VLERCIAKKCGASKLEQARRQNIGLRELRLPRDAISACLRAAAMETCHCDPEPLGIDLAPGLRKASRTDPHSLEGLTATIGRDTALKKFVTCSGAVSAVPWLELAPGATGDGSGHGERKETTSHRYRCCCQPDSRRVFRFRK
jgi:hypothetical protein